MINKLIRWVMHTAGSGLTASQRAWRRHVYAANWDAIVTGYYKTHCAQTPASADDVNRARRFLQKNFDGYSDTRWHELCWRITGNTDAAYIPPEIFYLRVEPTLNAMRYVQVLTDKNLHYNLPIAPYLPVPILHIVRGEIFLPGFVPSTDDRIDSIVGAISDDVIVKPATEHGGGVGLRTLPGSEAAKFLKEKLGHRDTRVQENWLVQHRLNQCSELARFNPSSINTYRITTLRAGLDIVYVTGMLRLGRTGMRFDDLDGGGIACGIDHGRLRGKGVDLELRVYDAHPDTLIPFSGELPSFEESVSLCKNLHRTLPWFDLVSWDVVIDARHEAKILEYNTAAQDILFQQMSNGPFFGSEGSSALSAMLHRLRSVPITPDFATG